VKLPTLHTTNGLGKVENFSDSSVGESFDTYFDSQVLHSASLEATLDQVKDTNLTDKSQTLLGLLLGCYIAESHGGKILIQGSLESGHRYVLTLPKIAASQNYSDSY
jgi:hypothetical protein